MEESESGAPIYRYDEKNRKEFELAHGGDHIEDISNHIEAKVGPVESVLHELVSDQVHIDVHWVKATSEQPFHTLVTSGMSDKAMNCPEGIEDADFAELSICLPEDWKLSDEAFNQEENYWPIRWLKTLARFPHEYNTWLSYGHSIPNGDPAEPFASNTKMSSLVLLPSIVFDESFHQLKLKNKTIDFYTLVPLYQEELELKMKDGVEALFEGFDKAGINDILDINRPSIVQKKKRFWFF